MTRKRKPSKSTLLILQTFYQAPEKGLYGYELMRITGLKSGTLYPILMRLKDRGYLTSEWGPSETPGRPPRQSYHLTSAGKAKIRDLMKDQEPTPVGFVGVST